MGRLSGEELIMALYCTRCGTGLPPSARFCSNCGTTVNAAQTVSSRPLYRPFAGRQLAGVCIALAQAYGWDVALVRIVAVIGFFCSGGVVAVAYLACWIGIPDEPIGLPAAYPPNPYPSNPYPPSPYPPNL
jgi:phage shock protein C